MANGRSFTWSGIRSICIKEITQLFRDKYLVGFIIALPIVQLLVTGLAIQKDLTDVPTIICNYDKRNSSQELLKAFQNSTFFDIQPENYVNSEREVIKGIRSGKYRVGIIIPPDYSDKVLSGSEKADVDIVVDGTNATISKSIMDSAQVIIAHFAVRLNDNQLVFGSSQDMTPIGLETKVLYNPDLKTSYFLIPAILGILMHMLTILFTSFTIVRERETGTLEQLMVTPVRVGDLMVGKMIPYTIIGFTDMILTLGVMVWFFHIPISGSFWFLCLASIVFILTSLAIGLVISTTCQNQVQAIQITVAILLPSLLLTGFVFPLEPMPWFIKVVSYSLPLTYYLEIIRGVVIKGIGFTELWVPTMILGFISVLMVVFSILRFKKQVA
jgi:ABC-2 type transport system permease protein